MTNPGRILVLSLALALPLTLPGCTGGIPTSEGLSVRVEPSEITFTHVVGQSPCPQLIGRVKVTNTSRTRTTTDFRSLSPAAPLAFGAGRATTLEPGESVTVDIFFTCAGRTSFVTTVDVIGENGSGFSQFTVRGTIVQ